LYKLVVICPDRIARGFALTGAEVLVSEAGPRTQTLLEDLITRKETGVILFPQEHLADFDPRTLKKLDALYLPLVVPVPMTSDATTSPEAYVAQMIRRAIGYDIKI